MPYTATTFCFNLLIYNYLLQVLVLVIVPSGFCVSVHGLQFVSTVDCCWIITVCGGCCRDASYTIAPPMIAGTIQTQLPLYPRCQCPLWWWRLKCPCCANAAVVIVINTTKIIFFISVFLAYTKCIILHSACIYYHFGSFIQGFLRLLNVIGLYS